MLSEVDFQVEEVFSFRWRKYRNILVSPAHRARGFLLNKMIDMLAPDLPSPWSTEEWATCFVVGDATGQPLAYVYFSDEPGRRAAAKLLSRHEARHVAEHFAQLPSLLHTAEVRRSGGLKSEGARSVRAAMTKGFIICVDFICVDCCAANIPIADDPHQRRPCRH